MSRVQILELALVVLLVTVGAALIPLSTGYFAWSWDALNHHVYLGMTAEYPRWYLDVSPASSQTYQYPYLYWPAYRLSLLSGSGAWFGAIWSAFQAVMVVVPLWWVSLRMLPDSGNGWDSCAQRLAACILAFINVVVLIGLETTASDVLSAVPLLWAIGLGLAPRSSHRLALLTATLLGASVAFKLSNGLFLPMLFFWWWQPEAPRLPLNRGLALLTGIILGFGGFYAPWGWQLWQVTGNPFYPYFGQIIGGS